ncbi:MAG: pentapeptide repeat-containing protein [Nitrospinae bacterium]|nr:pentapeptide repeat-containing protein [Nitrospinota bacterium]
MLKRVITFTSWLLGVYILLFTTSFYVHINETRIITNKANSLLHKLTDIDFSGLRKVSKTQNRKRKTKPVFFKPPTLYNSLFGEREFVNSANQLLRNRIEKLKRNLDNIAFSNAHFEGINLSNASMFNADLKSAKLKNADLSDANLIYADLQNTDFHSANLNRTNFYKSHFNNTFLQGANLSGAKNITCAQITLAMINESTHLPDYIRLEGSQCIHLREGKGWDLSNMNLAYGDFSNENFANANLNQANLKGANLSTTTNITCDQISSAIIDKNTQLPDYLYVTLPPQSVFKCIHLIEGKGANLKNANLQKIYLHRPDLQNADLSQANLENSHLLAANLANANLNQANLKGANLSTTKNITCDQVMSAIIDRYTRLPDYIHLIESSPSAQKCRKIVKKKK